MKYKRMVRQLKKNPEPLWGSSCPLPASPRRRPWSQGLKFNFLSLPGLPSSPPHINSGSTQKKKIFQLLEKNSYAYPIFSS